MKLLIQWRMFSAFAFAWGTCGHAQEILTKQQHPQEMRGFQISVPPSPPLPLPSTTLIPGLYVNAGQGAMAGGQEPRAFVVRIDRVANGQLTGELEVIRLDEKGKLVHLRSRLAGTVGIIGTAIEPGDPLTIALEDEPLRSLMTDVSGWINASGSVDAAGDVRIDRFNLRWKPVDKTLGYNRLGDGAAFVLSDNDGYEQVLAQYKEMAAYKKPLMEFQVSSADFAESRLETYMRETGELLQKPSPGDTQREIVEKAAALYEKEKALLGDKGPGTRESTSRQAELIAMQIDAYWSQVAYINERQTELSRYWLGRGASVSQLIWYSPCVSTTSPTHLNYGASPACKDLATAYDDVQKRMRIVTQALGNTMQSSSSMGCLWQAAHQMLNPRVRTIPDYCRQSLASLEASEAK